MLGGNLDQKRNLVARAKKLMDYMSYGWDKDNKFRAHIKDYQPKQDKDKAKDELEAIKRSYYQSYVDREFEKTF